MATRGFEFAYYVDGTNGTPRHEDVSLATATGGYQVGDLMKVTSSGYGDDITSTTYTGAILGVCMETVSSVASDGAETVKVAVGCGNQVWRVSMTGATAGAVARYAKALKVTSSSRKVNTSAGTVGTNNRMTLWDTGTDDEGNALAYVIFNKTDAEYDNLT